MPTWLSHVLDWIRTSVSITRPSTDGRRRRWIWLRNFARLWATRWFVCYDVCSPPRLRKVHKKMKSYGQPLQYSVFACDLSPREKRQLVAALQQVIDEDEDSIMLVDLGRADSHAGAAIEFLGERREMARSRQIVI